MGLRLRRGAKSPPRRGVSAAVLAVRPSSAAESPCLLVVLLSLLARFEALNSARGVPGLKHVRSFWSTATVQEGRLSAHRVLTTSDFGKPSGFRLTSCHAQPWLKRDESWCAAASCHPVESSPPGRSTGAKNVCSRVGVGRARVCLAGASDGALTQSCQFSPLSARGRTAQGRAHVSGLLCPMRSFLRSSSHLGM